MSDYGLLLNHDAKLQRKYFEEMCKLRGLKCIYKIPFNEGFEYAGEYKAAYSEGMEVYCILNQWTDNKTTQKMGWLVELSPGEVLLSVPYDLHGIQVGCLFKLPAAFDDVEGRWFRVVEMLATQIYPASITCKLVPEMGSDMDESLVNDFTMSSFNLLREGE